MIDRELPRLGWRNRFAVDEVLEAFSFTLMSSYEVGTFTARHFTSIQRAWGYSSQWAWDRIPNARPRVRGAIFDNPGVPRVLIAIEGMHSFSQLWAAFMGANGVNAAPLPGVVYHAFKTYADSLKAEFLADNQLMTLLARPNAAVTFTGYSLGAAVAEILAASFISTHPGKQYRLIKFGSPRVGNSDWTNGAELPTETVNIYANSDPIDLIPRVSLRQMQTLILPHLDAFTCYAKNLRQSRVSVAGAWDMTEHEDTYENYMRACIAGRRAMNSTNPWYWHDLQAYRLCLMNSVWSMRSLLPSRFRYMEFPGDERWGQNYTPGQLTYDGLMEPADPQTAEVVVASNDDEELMHTTRAAAPIIPQAPMRTGNSRPPTVRPPQPSWVPRRTRNY